MLKRKILIPLTLISLTIFCVPGIARSESNFMIENLPNNFIQTKSKIAISNPSIITRGFDALVNRDIQEAFKLWANYSIPLIRNNSPMMATFTESLIENEVGTCVGYEMINTMSLTEKTKIIFAESQHDRGAIFWRFTVTKSPQGLVITSIAWHTDPSEIIPINLIYESL